MGLSIFPAVVDTGWLSAASVGIAPSSNFTMTSGNVRVIGKRCTVHLFLVTAVTQTASEATGTHSGNLGGDPLIAQFPAGYRPQYQVVFAAGSSFGTFGVRLNTDGTLKMYDCYPEARLTAGDGFTVTIDYILAG